ncbi:MAG: 2-oxoglutarate and iron-dependent oxygenase domain-containing protein, partial [Actinomycetota bacterium]
MSADPIRSTPAATPVAAASESSDPVVLVDGYVPVIDVSAAWSTDVVDRRVVADAVARACENSGFFVITGHGVPTELVTRMEEVSLAFFALADEAKQRYAVADGDPTIRGYYATPSYVAASEDIETAPDLCQLYTICRLGEPGVATVESLGAEDHPVWSRPNVWPTEVPGFRETWLDYYGVLE